MSVARRLGVAIAAFLCACSIDLTGKTHCTDSNDCNPGYHCVATTNTCVADSGSAGTGGGANGGSAGTNDGGGGVAPPRMCPGSPVNVCDTPGDTCPEIFCGGRLWRDGVLLSLRVPYKIVDPNGMFSPSYRTAIRAAAAAWTKASSGFVTFQECPACLPPAVISVVPLDADGIVDGTEPSLPMPVVGIGGRVSPHRIAHQWGHAAGLSHTYERADRDRYVGFDPQVWCPPGGAGLPSHCAAGPVGKPGLPAVTTGTFGVFDGKSKMNGLRSEGICGAEEPDEDSSEPTIGDLSALTELFFGKVAGWSPFRPIGRSRSPTEPLDYQLVPGVDPVGSPAIAEVESAYARPEIFVRGTDDRVYATSRLDPLNSPAADWLDWTAVADDVDADPAVVFAVNGNPATLFLAVRSRVDGNIHLRVRRGETWGGWTSLGAPPSGAGSAPAIASESPFVIAIVVRGRDGLIYWLKCGDADADCASSAAGPDAWSALPSPLPSPSSRIFVGKPSAVWMRNGAELTVAAVRDDRIAVVLKNLNDGGTDWLPADNVNLYLPPDDPEPGVAITLLSTPGEVGFFARNQQGLLISETLQTKFFPIGGVLASPPGAVAIYQGGIRTDVAAIIDDHGHPGVWWRYNDGDYLAPCHYNRPGKCGECGL